ncbi:MAG TPA: TetR/AcrR family transcriptional regulator [Methylomusa anaerophila]|uniref:Bacterial regulatory proteins, tetR family n=1 Tax=Methylomusa anaerophila TaxID=1930071 RepID=A0A348AGA9_9FIRM|nr:TetR/AcrR family transcriptional regulator [Methylomusa anaerophila]BBB90107.1 bacterial regulatory proteins, tetR family [Methylomusa anaerophila]HML88168.1 TetR/AcrR family transcriptional regulator [Methylomusa anaerophila]
MRKRIMLAAAEEMRIKSIKFTMADLARCLGVSKRLLYEYFTSKEELIGAIIDQCLQEIHEQHEKILHDQSISYPERLKKMLTPQQNILPVEGQIADDIRRYLPAEWDKFDRLMDEKWGGIEKFLQEGIENGHLRPISLPIIKKMLSGAHKEIIDYRFLVHHNISLLQALTYTADVLMYGILADRTADNCPPE